MCERRVLFTALNLLLSMATSASEKSFSRRLNAMNWLQTRRIVEPLSLRKSAIVLKSGLKRPVNQTSSSCAA